MSIERPHFLVHALHDAGSVRTGLGTPDYSYHFVLESFVPLLERFGHVERIRDPGREVPARIETLLATGVSPVFLSFTPPHATCVDLPCPVVPVFAWEFSTLPEQVDGPGVGADWADVLRRCGAAITHSSFAADVVRAALGEAFPVMVLPAPVFDAFNSLAHRRVADARAPRALDIDALLLDSRAHEFFADGLAPSAAPPTGSVSAAVAPRWDGEPLHIEFMAGRCEALLVGFYECESWGVWSASPRPWVVLPRAVSGRLRVSLRISAFGSNEERSIRLSLGGVSFGLRLRAAPVEQIFEAWLPEPVSVLAFSGVIPERPSELDGARTLGIALWELRIERLPEVDIVAAPALAFDFSLAAGVGSLELEGFHAPEEWGVWSREAAVRLRLPIRIEQRFTVQANIRGFCGNAGRSLFGRVGAVSAEWIPGDTFSTFLLDGLMEEATDTLLIEGMLPELPLGTADPRELGIGLESLRLELHAEQVPSDVSAVLQLQAPLLEGCVYVAVLNPGDGRKNWKDILSAFCITFADEPDATLVVKAVHTQVQTYVKQLHSLLLQLAPFRCRVIVVHGYLDHADYARLIGVADYVVSASRGEGQCLPLMEYMSAGVPAIAPRNTAMRDYHDARSGFVVRSSPEPTFWPHDARQCFTTLRERLDWESLSSAFSESFRVYRDEPALYAALAAGAVEAQRRYCSADSLTGPLAELLERVSRQEPLT
jgi:glycosyltransferase involved in cell wall biosynthesis